MERKLISAGRDAGGTKDIKTRRVGTVVWFRLDDQTDRTGCRVPEWRDSPFWDRARGGDCVSQCEGGSLEGACSGEGGSQRVISLNHGGYLMRVSVIYRSRLQRLPIPASCRHSRTATSYEIWPLRRYERYHGLLVTST